MWNLSSLTRDGTYVPCIGRQILNHWITREVLQMSLFFSLLKRTLGTSLVVQWLKIYLAMQGTRNESLVQELRSHMPQGN